MKKIKVDSALTLDEALSGKEVPQRLRAMLALVDVEYWGFDDCEHRGQIVVHKTLAEEVREIFEAIREARFPLEKVIPVVRYNWSDDLSMADNNSSGFNYRRAVRRRRLSQHAWGRAIDINPRLNPYISQTLVLPPGAVYDVRQPGTVVEGGVVVRAFEERGWSWGGAWQTLRDWQHFEKTRA